MNFIVKKIFVSSSSYDQADMVRSDVSCYNSGPVPWRGGNKFR